jgi:hypothetical protein
LGLKRRRDIEEMDGVIRIGVVGLAVMGQNLALNIASKGFPCAVYNRSSKKVRVHTCFLFTGTILLRA